MILNSVLVIVLVCLLERNSIGQFRCIVLNIVRKRMEWNVHSLISIPFLITKLPYKGIIGISFKCPLYFILFYSFLSFQTKCKCLNYQRIYFQKKAYKNYIKGLLNRSCYQDCSQSILFEIVHKLECTGLKGSIERYRFIFSLLCF